MGAGRLLSVCGVTESYNSTMVAGFLQPLSQLGTLRLSQVAPLVAVEPGLE